MGAVAQRVGEVGGAAAELLHLDVTGQLACPAPASHFADRLDVEAVLLAHLGGAVELAQLSHRPCSSRRLVQSVPSR